MNLYAYTIATPIATYHDCICAPDRDSAFDAVIASLPSDSILIELEQV
jgi:hypothetical protein